MRDDHGFLSLEMPVKFRTKEGESITNMQEVAHNYLSLKVCLRFGVQMVLKS